MMFHLTSPAAGSEVAGRSRRSRCSARHCRMNIPATQTAITGISVRMKSWLLGSEVPPITASATTPIRPPTTHSL